MASGQPVPDATRRAVAAAAAAATLPRAVKDRGLRAAADALLAHRDQLLAANRDDVQRARDERATPALVDRLAMDGNRLAGSAEGLRQLADLPDPVGEVVRGSTLPNGLRLRQLRVPLGVVGVIYEARPNVTVDAAGLCVKSGNAVLLRGSSAASSTNAALVDVLTAAGRVAGWPEHLVQLLPGDHDSAKQLMRARGLVDVLIPRGGPELIRTVVAESTVPVVETGVGNCHVYVDAAADLDMALAIVLNAKTQRPAVCNAAETLLVHRGVADEFLPRVLPALRDAGVTVHGDATVAGYHGVRPATDQDWATEYLSLDLAVAVVDSLAVAVEHIRRWGSGHTEAIVTGSLAAADRFVAEVDAAAVMVNASTRFSDGAEFGLGAEIGISTQKLHARGPMGLAELTSTKWVVTGDGQLRG